MAWKWAGGWPKGLEKSRLSAMLGNWKRCLVRPKMPARTTNNVPNVTEASVDPALDVVANNVKLATAAARQTWNNVLVRPK